MNGGARMLDQGIIILCIIAMVIVFFIGTAILVLTFEFYLGTVYAGLPLDDGSLCGTGHGLP